MEARGTRALMAVANPNRRRRLGAQLRQHGLQVLEAATALDALSLLRRPGAEIAFVGCHLPDLGAIELVRRIRCESPVSVIVLVDPGETAEGIRALDSGADDYMVEPCQPQEMVARTRAVLRRSRSPELGASVCRSGQIELDLVARRCRSGGREVHLTPREFDLLSALLRYEGRLHTRSELLALVWGDAAISPGRVDLLIATLRRKLGPGVAIDLVPGTGYRLGQL